MACDERGRADIFHRKIAVCRRAYNLLTGTAEFSPSDIIFDPNILTVATGLEEHRNYAVDFIEAVRWIKANLPGARTSGGRPYISFSFCGKNCVRRSMQLAVLFYCFQGGVFFVIDDTRPAAAF